LKKRVLVFPCGSEIGLEIAQSLKYSRHFELWGASSVPDHGRFVFKNYIQMNTAIQDDVFVTELLNIVSEYNIDFIFPAHDSVVLKLSECRSVLPCAVITSSYETCSVCRSKKKTYDRLNGIVAVPRIYDDFEKIKKYPVFLKPDVGQGSKGIAVAYSKEDIVFYQDKDPSLIVLEYLPGKEYTVDCFTDRNGKLLIAEGRERVRISNGISVNTAPCDNKEFAVLAEKINSVLTFSGAWFFQVKENETNEMVLMEVAPRIAGSMGLDRNRGMNLPLMSLFDASGLEVNIQKNSFEIEMDRALGNSFRMNIEYDSVYVDYDDTLIVDGKINTQLVRFLYQCVNKGVRLLLLTRHNGDIKDRLACIRMGSLFDEVIHIDKNEPKSKYIKGNAIFIDDSFMEREDVLHVCGIPVFDPCMVESLIDGSLQ